MDTEELYYGSLFEDVSLDTSFEIFEIEKKFSFLSETIILLPKKKNPTRTEREGANWNIIHWNLTLDGAPYDTAMGCGKFTKAPYEMIIEAKITNWTG